MVRHWLSAIAVAAALACLPVADASAIPSGITRLMNVTPGGAQGNSGFGQAQAISDNGRFVVFLSTDTDLISPAPTYTATKINIFIRDVVTGTTKLVSVNPDGTAAGDNYSSMAVVSA